MSMTHKTKVLRMSGRRRMAARVGGFLEGLVVAFVVVACIAAGIALWCWVTG